MALVGAGRKPHTQVFGAGHNAKGSRATLKRKWRMTQQRSISMRLRPDCKRPDDSPPRSGLVQLVDKLTGAGQPNSVAAA
jgi:hypothetical protein